MYLWKMKVCGDKIVGMNVRRGGSVVWDCCVNEWRGG